MFISRRKVLSQAMVSLAGCAAHRGLSASEPPAVVNPRATDGDDQFQPRWDERLEVTVGPKTADIVGSDDKAIQAAIEYVVRFGGGTVKILPGTYTLRNSVYLPSGIRVCGSGPESIVTKIASQSVQLSEDSDWYDQEITLADAKGFKVGDGILLQAKNPHHGGAQVIRRTLVARSGNRFKLNQGIRNNLWLSEKPTCASLFPLFTSERTSDVIIENVTIDGNRKNNANLNGNYGGNIFLQDCRRYTIRNVESRQYNGDGLSFQVCHDVVVEDCHIHDNANLGVHPGSGSQRPLIRNCQIERNNLGIYWCWGVKYGLADGNQIHDNHTYGISIGHNDTDNVMRNNDIRRSGRVGILFRDDQRGKDFWANRNLVENNRIVDSGPDDGVAIDIQGNTKDVTIRGNEIRENRGPKSRIGIRVDKAAENLTLSDNEIHGFDQAIVDAPAA